MVFKFLLMLKRVGIVVHMCTYDL